MIPKDFVEDVKKYGGFSISELRNGYIEISTEVSGKIAVSPSEVKEFFSMLGLITESDLRPSTLDAQISELNKALDKENNKERKGRLLAAHHALLWVKHPDWFEPPMSLTLMSEPLREGYLRKGGNNPACSQIIKRPEPYPSASGNTKCCSREGGSC